jgi:hypothetical protein
MEDSDRKEYEKTICEKIIRAKSSRKIMNFLAKVN